jgi:hypothetical protein
MLISRFDLSGRKMRRAIQGIAGLGRRFGYSPALIVPAIVLHRHRHILNDGSCQDLELAIHGYTHKNMRPLSLEAQVQEVRKARQIFDQLGVKARGFRAPYLSCNTYTERVVSYCGLAWNSDTAFMANGILHSHMGRPRRLVGRAVQQLYMPDDAADRLLAPWILEKTVCIPILLPDDEILVDRLGIDQPDAVADIWLKMLQWVRARGGLFVLQLHPERFSICSKAMELLLEQTSIPGSGTWMAAMGQIADWWMTRDSFKFVISPADSGAFDVLVKGPPNATIVGLNLPSDLGKPFFGGYRQIKARQFRVTTDGKIPCVGIHPDAPTALAKFIHNAGFASEVSDVDKGYAMYFGSGQAFRPSDEIRVINQIESAGRPVLRCWPWPNGYKSAFATTHDLDSVTLTDFLYRLLGK